MGRNKKDATQDVLNLYNQMQEDENIESGKEEIKVTLEEIESAKKVLYEAKEERAMPTIGWNQRKWHLWLPTGAQTTSLTEYAMPLSRLSRATSKLASMMKDLPFWMSGTAPPFLLSSKPLTSTRSG